MHIISTKQEKLCELACILCDYSLVSKTVELSNLFQFQPIDFWVLDKFNYAHVSCDCVVMLYAAHLLQNVYLFLIKEESTELFFLAEIRFPIVTGKGKTWQCHFSPYQSLSLGKLSFYCIGSIRYFYLLKNRLWLRWSFKISKKICFVNSLPLIHLSRIKLKSVFHIMVSTAACYRL